MDQNDGEGQILKTRYKYKSLCGQSKTIIFLFSPGQLILLFPHRVLFNCQKPSEAKGLALNVT